MDTAEYAHGDRAGRVAQPRDSMFRKADQTGVPLLLARLLLGCMFIYMGALKIGQPIEFLKQIRLYHMMPERPAYFLTVTAITLPWLEVLTGVGLVLGVWLRGSALLVAGMLAVFTPAIFLRAWNIHTESAIPFLDVKFDCGCGSGVVITWKKLVENTGLFLLAAYVLLSRSRRFCFSSELAGLRANA